MQINSGINVLLVDDEPANLLALEVVLETLGANLVRANSGEQALRKLQDTDFALTGALDGQPSALRRRIGFRTPSPRAVS